MNRKQHAGEAGYICERMNPNVPKTKVVIYRTADQNLDNGEAKYTVVCGAHDTMVGETAMTRARLSMKMPENFCDECRALTLDRG